MKAGFNIDTSNGVTNCATKHETIQLKIKLSERISARTSNTGDTFTAKTVEDATIGGVCYPAGSTVKGIVSSVSRPGVKNPGYVEIEFKSISNGDNCAEFPKQMSCASVDVSKTLTWFLEFSQLLSQWLAELPVLLEEQLLQL